MKLVRFPPIQVGYFLQIAENNRIWLVGNYVIHHSDHKNKEGGWQVGGGYKVHFMSLSISQKHAFAQAP